MDKHNKAVFLSAGIVGLFLVLACAGTLGGLIYTGAQSAGVTVGGGGKKGTGTKTPAKPEVVSVTIAAPARVKPGEKFDIKVVVHNGTHRRASLYSIDINNAYANGFSTNEIDPPSSGTETNANSRVLMYDAPILAGEEKVVLFRCSAGKEGYYKGDFDVYINNARTIHSHTLHLAVGEAGDQAMKAAGVTEDVLKAQSTGGAKSPNGAKNADEEEDDEE